MLRVCHWAALLAIWFWIDYVAAAPFPCVQWSRLSNLGSLGTGRRLVSRERVPRLPILCALRSIRPRVHGSPAGRLRAESGARAPLCSVSYRCLLSCMASPGRRAVLSVLLLCLRRVRYCSAVSLFFPFPPAATPTKPLRHMGGVGRIRFITLMCCKWKKKATICD